MSQRNPRDLRRDRRYDEVDSLDREICRLREDVRRAEDHATECRQQTRAERRINSHLSQVNGDLEQVNANLVLKCLDIKEAFAKLRDEDIQRHTQAQRREHDRNLSAQQNVTQLLNDLMFATGQPQSGQPVQLFHAVESAESSG